MFERDGYVANTNNFGRRPGRPTSSTNAPIQSERKKFTRNDTMEVSAVNAASAVSSYSQNAHMVRSGIAAFIFGFLFQAHFGFNLQICFIQAVGVILILYPAINWLMFELGGRSLDHDLSGPGAEKAIDVTHWVQNNRTTLIVVIALVTGVGRLFFNSSVDFRSPNHLQPQSSVVRQPMTGTVVEATLRTEATGGRQTDVCDVTMQGFRTGKNGEKIPMTATQTLEKGFCELKVGQKVTIVHFLEKSPNED
jgi:hypothetical protein